MKILDNVEMEAESRAHVLAPPSQSENDKATGIILRSLAATRGSIAVAKTS